MADRVLVTGGAGFIGSHLVRRLLELGREVRVLDDLSTGRRENLSGIEDSIEFLERDLRDPDVCARACADVDVVYHQAAIPSVVRSIAQPEQTFEVNVVGTHTLLLAARAAGVRRVVAASSSSVYGDQPDLPKHEGMKLAPLSPYASHKATFEQLASAFSASLGLEVVALRYFNVYGPRQDPTSEYSAVIPKFVTLALRNEPAIIYGDGRQTRDFTFVADVVRANLAAGQASGAAGRAINIAGGVRTSVLDLHGHIARLTGREDLPPVHEPSRAGEVLDSLASIELASELLGWAPELDLAAGLRETVDSYRS